MTSNTVNLDWDFWSSQLNAIQAVRSNDYDIVNFQGGFRSGKSVTGARMAVLEALQNPGSHNIAMGTSFQEAKKTTYEVLFDMALPGDNLDPYNKGGDPTNSPIVKDFNKQDGNIVVGLKGREPSTISLGSADKSSRYEGGSFDLVWMDEAGLYGTELFGIMDTFLQRTRQQLWTTTGKGEALKKIVEENVDRDGNELGNSIKTVKASTLNNPFLEESKKQRLRDRYSGTKNAEMALKGGFGQKEGLVYSDFARHKHIVKNDSLKLDDGWGRIYAYDEGWNDPTVMLEIGMTQRGQLVALDCFYERKSDVNDAIKWLKDNEKRKGRIFSEHEPKDIREMRKQLGWTVLKAEKDLNSGIKTLRNRLRLDEKERPGLLVAEDCSKLISEFNNYQEEDVGASNAKDHALDCLRYGVMGVEKQGNRSNVSVGSVSAV